MNALSIAVPDVAALGIPRPVTGGVPIAQGLAPAGAAFALHSESGDSVALQTHVLARWQDGSARWVLLDFESDGGGTYALTWGEAGDAIPASMAAPDVAVQSGDPALVRIGERVDVRLVMTNERGETCRAAVESAAVEAAGPVRTTHALSGAFFTSGGERVFQFRLRASAFAGLPYVRLEPMILVDAASGVVQHIREVKLTVSPCDEAGHAQIGGDPGWQGDGASQVRLLQYDDGNYRFEGADGVGRRAPGWAALDGAAAALRDFWQQWPKSLEASPEGLSIGLLPRFTEGDFAHMEPWYKHQYFFEGDCYRLRTGQARRWDVWLDLDGDGESLAKMANTPLIPIADPGQAIAAGVWDEIMPAGTPDMAEYDRWAENLFGSYCKSIETQRDYGAMNWGDWFGERYVNWGNHEYDTTNQVLIQFARTGDPKYFYVADTAARHSAEVDTVHFVNDDLATYFGHWGRPTYPPRAGMVHQHAVGHVGGFHDIETVRKLYVEHGVGGTDNPYLCLDPFNLGHVYTQGTARQYLLTGDPFLKETVTRIADNIAQLVEDREYEFMGHSHCGRTTGWPLLALAGAYDITLDERYLNAMRTLADDALAEQDPNCGGWLHSLPRGHCYCEAAKHTGMAGFITAVLINGLSRYYLLTGDERIVDCVDRAVTFLDNDTWREEWQDWRYTSCPASNRTSQPGVVVMAHVNAVRIASNPEHLRVLRIAWDAKFKSLIEAPAPGPGQGKTYSSKAYGCAQAVGLLAKPTDN